MEPQAQKSQDSCRLSQAPSCCQDRSVSEQTAKSQRQTPPDMFQPITLMGAELSLPDLLPLPKDVDNLALDLAGLHVGRTRTGLQ